MIYTVPHYYGQFRCIASDCPDTCCAGWAIMIDGKSLEKYRHMEGRFGSRLHNSVNWRDASFKQYHGRCAFLNEENLCDLYTEAGSGYLCQTCRSYPRHVEEFEGCREISLCLSCIQAARIILGSDEPVRFITREDGREESDEDFDFFLYTKLMDARELAFKILQNRRMDSPARISLCLALAHDLQARMNRGMLCLSDQLFERCRRSLDTGDFKKKLEHSIISGPGRYDTMKEMFALFSGMETLKPDWPGYRNRLEEILYRGGREQYQADRRAFIHSAAGEKLDLWREQLMVYFVFTYFCGAVYNGTPFGKMKMAAAGVLLIEEMGQALWKARGGRLELEEFADAAHRFSREVEHSDVNKGYLESALVKSPVFCFKSLLNALNC